MTVRDNIKALIYRHIDKSMCPEEFDFFKSGVVTSFQLVRLYGQLEREFDVIISLDKLLDYNPRTVSQIVDMFFSVYQDKYE